jgi:hypothetical protein
MPLDLPMWALDKAVWFVLLILATVIAAMINRRLSRDSRPPDDNRLT